MEPPSPLPPPPLIGGEDERKHHHESAKGRPHQESSLLRGNGSDGFAQDAVVKLSKPVTQAHVTSMRRTDPEDVTFSGKWRGPGSGMCTVSGAGRA